MADFIECIECGDRFYRKDQHECLGSATERICALESRVGELEQQVEDLKTRLERLTRGRV